MHDNRLHDCNILQDNDSHPWSQRRTVLTQRLPSAHPSHAAPPDAARLRAQMNELNINQCTSCDLVHQDRAANRITSPFLHCTAARQDACRIAAHPRSTCKNRRHQSGGAHGYMGEASVVYISVQPNHSRKRRRRRRPPFSSSYCASTSIESSCHSPGGRLQDPGHGSRPRARPLC